MTTAGDILDAYPQRVGKRPRVASLTLNVLLPYHVVAADEPSGAADAADAVTDALELVSTGVADGWFAAASERP